jgi:hypothetical protein
MKTYLGAWKERMIRNEQYLFDFAKELKNNGFEVLFYSSDINRDLGGYIITKNNKHVTLCFSEVPYHWTLGINWEPNHTNGSGRTVLEKYDLSKVDFTIEEIEKNLYENYVDINKMYSWTKLLDISEHPRFK